MSAIHKDNAVFCVECEFVSERETNGLCPKCQSSGVLNLAAILDRTPEPLGTEYPNHWLNSDSELACYVSPRPEVQA